jgi:hypothetical protein
MEAYDRPTKNINIWKLIHKRMKSTNRRKTITSPLHKAGLPSTCYKLIQTLNVVSVQCVYFMHGIVQLYSKVTMDITISTSIHLQSE